MEQEKDDFHKATMEDICSSLPALSIEEDLYLIKQSNMNFDRRLVYNSNCRYQGLMIIFNHILFEPELDLPKREDTDVDCTALIHCFKTFGFKCELYHDLTGSEIYKKLSKVKSDESLEQFECFAIVVLSHGDKGVIYAKDGPYYPNTLWSPFTAKNCPSLAGKPKLIFIQACRGRKTDPGYDFNNPETALATNTGGKVFLPAEDEDNDHDFSVNDNLQPDFLVMFATMPGHYAFKNNRGSWFIKALCEELLEKFDHFHLLQILSFVCQKVASYQSRSCQPDLHRKKQICNVSQNFSKLLFFRAMPVDLQKNQLKMSVQGDCCSFI